jgi:hypothetical protein
MTRSRLPNRALAASTAVAALLVFSPRAFAIDADIDFGLPYSVSYELAPINVKLKLKGETRAKYHVYDIYKNELGSGDLDSGTTPELAFEFTPPKYGWYAVTVESDGRGVSRFVGVTPEYESVHTLTQGQMKGGWNDSALIAFAGLGLDRTNTRHKGIDGIAETLANSEKYGVPLLVQFEGKDHCTVGHVTEAVTKYRGRVKYWEIMNEPNFSMSPQDYARLVTQLVPVMKRIDPAAKVMGPDVCGVDLGWYENFYKAGGGKYLDIISIHDYEGDGGIDAYHWLWKIGELRKIMARYGDANKELWQTERAINGVYAGFFCGASQAIRITMQRDVLEIFGVTNEHNSHYYANVTGYNDVSTFVYSDSGPYPAALACRTRSAMTKGRDFAEKLDFGATGDTLFLGLLYKGTDGSTVTLRNLGAVDQVLEFAVAGGRSVTVVDTFGNEATVPVRGGKARLAVGVMPTYVRLARGQRLSPPKIDLGANLATQATFAYSGQSNAPSSLLNDGKYQVFHNQNPWGNAWSGAYTGRRFNDMPQTLDISFNGPKEVGARAIYGQLADNPHCALLDYDVQYRDGERWVTLEERRTPCPQSDAATTVLGKSMTWYMDHNLYIHRFDKPVTTDKLRLLVRRISRGCFIDAATEDALGWKPSAQTLEIREIEVYGPVPDELVLRRAKASDVAASAVARRRRAEASSNGTEAEAASLKIWDDKLRARLREAVASGQRERYFMAAMRQKFTVVKIDDKGDMEVLGNGATFHMKWKKLPPADKRSLALAALREGEPADHCLAAFFLMTTGMTQDAHDHLAKGGKGAAEVKAAFAGGASF